MTTAQNPLLIDNPLIPATRTGTLDLTNPTTSYQLSLKGSTNNTRIFLTDLTGNADVRVLDSNNQVLSNTSQSNTGNASEAILLSKLSAGTYTIEVALADNAGLASYKLNVTANSDAELSNLFWRNTATQQTAVWNMFGTDMTNSKLLDNVPPEWTIQARGDLTLDGEEDLIWRNSKNGQVGLWAMQNGVMTASRAIDVSLDWQIIAVKDLNSDGRADLVWRNNTTGDVAYWTFKANLQFDSTFDQRVSRVPLEWQIVNVADVNGDNKADLLWRNSRTGEFGIWLTDTSTNWATSYNVGTDWVLQTTGDFNNDGQADLVWRNTRNGLLGIWLMNGLNYTSTWSINVPLSWQVVNVGNFSGKGGDGLLWRNSSGEAAIWLLTDDGTKIDKAGVVSSYGVNWQVAGVGDFNNDGKTDIIYRNTSQASVKVALVDGLQQLDTKDYTGVDPGWQFPQVLKRKIFPIPFSLNDGTVANAFDIGQLNGKAVYSDRVRKGVTEYYRFNVAVQTDINLSALKGNVTIDLYTANAGNQLGTKLSSTTTVTAGSYLIAVSTQSDAPIDYTLQAEGLPNILDLYGTRFEGLSSNINLNPSAGGAPNVIDAKFSIRNSGKFTINAFDVGFRISRDSVINPASISDAIVQVQNADGTAFGDLRTFTQALKPGETYTATVKLRLPDTIDGFWLADGKYYLGLVVDPQDKIQESDESNNYNTGFGLDKFETVIRGTETVELVGSEFTVLNKNFVPGGSVTVRYTIQNIGNKPVPNGINIPIRFYLSTDSNIQDNSNDWLMSINNSSTDEDSISSSALGGATNGQPTGVTRTVTLLLPSATDWTGWNTGTQFYLGDWIYTSDISLVEADSTNNKINLDPTDPSTDTIGKNYTILTRS